MLFILKKYTFANSVLQKLMIFFAHTKKICIFVS